MKLSIGAVLFFTFLCSTPGQGLPPGAVTDLVTTHHNNHLTVRFTAPDVVVAKFIIKYAERAEDLQGVNFSNDDLNEEIEQSDLVHGSIVPPTEAGTEISLHVDPFEVFEGKRTYFFAMKSVTASLEYSQLSNIAEATVDTAGDNTPPRGITNLDVSLVNNELIVTFTCPGDDGVGNDTVSKISIRYAAYSNNINQANFHNDNLNDEVEQDDLISGFLQPPAGNTNMTIKIKPSSVFEFSGPYFFAVKTVDDTFNWSELSNIANVTQSSDPSPNEGPTAVTDFVASYQSGDLSLTFTAPAASPGSQSPVTRFVVRYSHHRQYVTENNFHNHEGNDDVEYDDIISGSLTTPPAPGTAVALRLKPYEIFDDDDGHYEVFFSMMSVDDRNRWSKLSNIVSVSYHNNSSSLSFNLQAQAVFLVGIVMFCFF